jgi:hypothetical protein
MILLLVFSARDQHRSSSPESHGTIATDPCLDATEPGSRCVLGAAIGDAVREDRRLENTHGVIRNQRGKALRAAIDELL